MGRNELPPCDYKPALQFYLRKVEEGGDLLVPGEFHAAMDALARRTCLVLVHGFNNSYSGAADAYLAFRRMEKKWYSDVDAARFEAQFGDTFWPGDADWGFFDKLDFLIYPRSVHTAVDAGRALADLLLRMPNLERVDFIAHTLGCRVVQESLAIKR
jgi:esterase/lipase superfamily enzyme